MKVYIMRGLPGSGKTTWLKTYWPKVKVFSTDHYFMVEGEYRFDLTKLGAYHNRTLRSFIFALLAKEEEILAVDNTNINQYEIAPYYRAAEVFGWDVKIIQLDYSLETCIANNTHNVPIETMKKMAKDLESVKLPSWWCICNS